MRQNYHLEDRARHVQKAEYDAKKEAKKENRMMLVFWIILMFLMIGCTFIQFYMGKINIMIIAIEVGLIGFSIVMAIRSYRNMK